MGAPFRGTPFVVMPLKGSPFKGIPFMGSPLKGSPLMGSPFQGRSAYAETALNSTRPQHTTTMRAWIVAPEEPHRSPSGQSALRSHDVLLWWGIHVCL